MRGEFRAESKGGLCLGYRKREMVVCLRLARFLRRVSLPTRSYQAGKRGLFARSRNIAR